jgi:hypothetical protein
MASTTEVKTDERAMRFALYEYTYHFSRRVELASKRIAAEGGDPQVARRALYWRLAAVSEVQRAAFQQDVLIGLLDAWTLALQQREFFAKGAGRDAFGAAQPLALEASAKLLEAAIETAKPFGTDLAMQNGEKYVGEWAAANPIRDISFTRRSIAPRFADRLAQDQGEHGPTQSLANIESSIEDLLQRINVYSDQMPRQAMGESEQLLDVFLEKPRLLHTFEMIESMRGDMGTMTAVVAEFPKMMRAERIAAFESVATERGLMLEAVTRERLALQEALQQERGLVMGDAKHMLHEALETLVAERQAAMNDLPAATEQSIALSQRRLESLIDRLVWGFAVLIGAAGVALTLLVVVAKRSGFFAPHASDGFLHKVPKVVAKT